MPTRSTYVAAIRVIQAIILFSGMASWVEGAEHYPAYAPVVDEARVLSESERARLTERLVQFKTRVGSEVAILIVPTLAGQDLAMFANELANQWKPGRQGIGDGVVVVLVTNDRQARIEVAKALEGAIPDAVAKRILAEQMRPMFAKGAYYDGLDVGLTALFARIEAERLPAPKDGASAQRSVGFGTILGFCIAELLPIFLFVAGQVGFQVAGARSRFVAPVFAIVVSAVQALLCLFWLDSLPTIGTLGIIASLLLAPIFLGRHFWQIATAQIVPIHPLLAYVASKFEGKVSFESDSSRGSSGGSSSDSSSSASSSSSGGGDFGGGGASDRW